MVADVWYDRQLLYAKTARNAERGEIAVILHITILFLKKRHWFVACSLASSIREAYKFYIATNPQVRASVSGRSTSTEATKTRWFGFKTIVQEILSNPGDSGEANDPLFEAKVLFKAGYFPAAGSRAGVILERYLKTLCELQTPSLKLRGNTIDPLSETLEICPNL